MIDCVLAGGHLLAHAREMAAGDVAGFMREHADHLDSASPHPSARRH